MNNTRFKRTTLWSALFILVIPLLSVTVLNAWPARAAQDLATPPGLYWTEMSSDTIYRANFDGSQIQEVLDMTGTDYDGRNPAAIIIDQSAGEIIFWAEALTIYQPDLIWRAGLDGSDLRPAFSDIGTFCGGWEQPNALALDTANHDLYWPSNQPCYWDVGGDDPGSIVRGNLNDGDYRFRFLPGPRDPAEYPEEQPDLELDQEARLFYWSDHEAIRRATLDGIEAEAVQFWGRSETSIGNPPIALDTEAGMIYLVGRSGDYDNPKEQLLRADLKTPWKQEILLTESEKVQIMDIAVDTIHDQLFWSVRGWEIGIRRANLDGTAVQTIVDQVYGPQGLAVDPVNGKIYWADWVKQKIQRADLDGMALEDLVDTAPVRPRFLALNDAEGIIYWTGQGNGRVWQAPRDGGAYKLLVPGAASKTGGIAYDSLSDALFWVDTARRAITTARSDGTGVADILYPRVGDAHALFLEEESGKIAWYDKDTRSIKRANLDGSATETILSDGFELVTSLAWDPLRRVFCWADPWLRHIECAGWDGEQRHTILAEADGLRRPNFLAIDPHTGQVYWTDWSTQSVHRANLDGGDAVVIVDGGLVEPSGLALNLEPLTVRRLHLPLVIGPSSS